jgi:Holliday junction resolvasome RuvABC endonuclease subunit
MERKSNPIHAQNSSKSEKHFIIKGKHGYIVPLVNPELRPNVRILAIDQASKLGWALSTESYGVWDLTTRKDESIGMKLLRFEVKLLEVIELAQINLIVYERVAGRFKSALIHAAKLVAIIESTCEKQGINYRAYSAKEIKQFATGKGNCGKPDMIKAAKEKLGYLGNDDNEADALWILMLAKNEFK